MRLGCVLPRDTLKCVLLCVAMQVAAQQPKQAKTGAIAQADAAFHAGSAAREAGDLELARAKFAEVIRLEPQIAEGHEALGAVLAELGRASEGLAQFEAAARLK